MSRYWLTSTKRSLSFCKTIVVRISEPLFTKTLFFFTFSLGGGGSGMAPIARGSGVGWRGRGAPAMGGTV